MALQNARDVFVRRPHCHSLWVAPASAIFTRTAEELAAGSADRTPEAGSTQHRQAYQVFHKLSQRQAETYVTHAGAVEAESPAEALRLAHAQFGGQAAYVWWIVPDSAIVRSDPGEADSLFAPALDKPYRQPGYYPVLTQMRAVRAQDGAAPASSPEPET
jgi:ring-1,2-phenylacetyl-CoA epoxidase subunit PaaB